MGVCAACGWWSYLCDIYILPHSCSRWYTEFWWVRPATVCMVVKALWKLRPFLLYHKFNKPQTSSTNGYVRSHEWRLIAGSQTRMTSDSRSSRSMIFIPRVADELRLHRITGSHSRCRWTDRYDHPTLWKEKDTIDATSLKRGVRTFSITGELRFLLYSTCIESLFCTVFASDTWLNTPGTI